MTADRQGPPAPDPAGADGETAAWARGEPLPADSHVHSEWSWDALAGNMERTCEQAVRVGLGSLAFTEHVDFTRWRLHDAANQRGRGTILDGTFQPGPLDVEGYLECIERCRARFPELAIRTGVELGEAHLHRKQVDALLAGGAFERRLGSLHSLPEAEPEVAAAQVAVRTSFEERPPLDVVRHYLAELERMVASDPPFDVLAHIDYPQRYWPRDLPPFDPRQLEEEYRSFLRLLADTGRALEINTRLPLVPTFVAWWHESGGTAVSFASDAHAPDRLAWAFRDAAGLAAAHGFRPGSIGDAFWARA